MLGTALLRSSPMHAIVARPTRIADLPGPRGLPLVGNAHQIRLPTFHQQLEGWREQHGDAYRMRIWGRRFVVLGDPQLAAEALRDRPGTFGRTARISTAAAEIGFGGLFASHGEKWRPPRPRGMGAFDPRPTPPYFPSL